jgi:hypothetical protein
MKNKEHALDRSHFNLLIDDAICKQIWLGNAQRARYSLARQIEIEPDPAKQSMMAKAEEEVMVAQKQSTEAIGRLSQFLC